MTPSFPTRRSPDLKLRRGGRASPRRIRRAGARGRGERRGLAARCRPALPGGVRRVGPHRPLRAQPRRSEEHTSELQSLMRISYAVSCLKQQNKLSINEKHTPSKYTIKQNDK